MLLRVSFSLFAHILDVSVAFYLGEIVASCLGEVDERGVFHICCKCALEGAGFEETKARRY